MSMFLFGDITNKNMANLGEKKWMVRVMGDISVADRVLFCLKLTTNGTTSNENFRDVYQQLGIQWWWLMLVNDCNTDIFLWHKHNPKKLDLSVIFCVKPRDFTTSAVLSPRHGVVAAHHPFGLAFSDGCLESGPIIVLDGTNRLLECVAFVRQKSNINIRNIRK